jgi:pyruvate dehydrogenase E1 component beta subunit
MVIEPLRGYRQFRGEVPAGDYTVPIGKARVAREGTDCTVIAWSAAVELAKQAAAASEQQGVSVEVIDLRSLVPMDMDTLRESVTKTGRAVVIHEASLTGGFAAEVITSLQEDGEIFYSLQAPMQRVCGPDTPYPVQELEEGYLINQERVLKAILKTLEG